MSRLPKWFERKFPRQVTADVYPNLICRLRGTPAHLEELLRGLPRDAVTAADGTWSMQENAGHLLDLEELWDGRLDDYLGGAVTLREADLSNRKTHQANHNERDPGELQAAFRRARTQLVNRLRGLPREDFERVATHPRLKTPMRLIDFLVFVAEHDDHHLARIQEQREQAGLPEPGDIAAPCGTVAHIHVAPHKKGELEALQKVRAHAGHGLEGDRYLATDDVAAKKQATLIEAEALESAARDYGVEIAAGESRRNITTRGVALNHLVGVEFTVGEVRMRGIKLCEPCGYLEKLTGKEMRKVLLHRGGLRAEILSSGMIRVGDPVSR